VTARPDIRATLGEQPHTATSSQRVGAADSHASLAARPAGRRVRGWLPLTGRVQTAEPIEELACQLGVQPDFYHAHGFSSVARR